MKFIKMISKLFVLGFFLSFAQLSLACDTFDAGNDQDECLANCVNAGCDTGSAGCSNYCGMQTFSPE